MKNNNFVAVFNRIAAKFDKPDFDPTEVDYPKSKQEIAAEEEEKDRYMEYHMAVLAGWQGGSGMKFIHLDGFDAYVNEPVAA